MENFLLLIIVIVCLLLGLVVLIQNPKGGGLAVGFQGAGQMGGVQQTADFLEKATRYLAITLFVLCMISAYVYDKDTAAPAGPGTESAAPGSGGDGTSGDQAPADGQP